MRRPLESECVLDGDLTALRVAFRSDPGRWLPEPARWHGKGHWNVQVRAGRLSRVVLCQVGGVWRVGEEQWRLLAWEPVEQAGDALPVGRALPAFTGELGVLQRDGHARLVLRGTYTPPAGPIGAAADAAALHRVASATGTQFLEAVAARLARLAAARAGGHPAG